MERENTRIGNFAGQYGTVPEYLFRDGREMVFLHGGHERITKLNFSKKRKPGSGTCGFLNTSSSTSMSIFHSGVKLSWNRVVPIPSGTHAMPKKSSV